MSVAFLAIVLGIALVAMVLGARIRAGAARRGGPRYFSNEYRDYMRSLAWREKRAAVLRTTFGRDAVLPWLRATQVDHLTYRRTFGTERPWFELVPLHEGTHRVVTALRDAGLRAPTNAMLRLFYGAWFIAYAAPIVAVATLAIHLARPTLTLSALVRGLMGILGL